MLSCNNCGYSLNKHDGREGYRDVQYRSSSKFSRAWQENPNGSHKTTLESGTFAGVCGLERSYYGGVERGKRNVTFKVLCLSCDGLACDVATITQGLPHLIQAVPGSIGKWRPATARMLGRRSMKIKRLGNAYCAVRLGTPPGELLPVSGTTFTAYLH